MICIELAISFTEPLLTVFENQSTLTVQVECSQPPYRNIPFTVKPIAVNVTSMLILFMSFL